jgi:hypothetical protein
MFCYFIQKKGFLNFDRDYLRHKLEWTQEQQGENQFFGTFYRGFLCALFHCGLNSPEHDAAFERKYGRIPYLNGGLFDEHTLEKQYAGIDIADRAFKDLFDFFDKWRWHLDTRITASGKDINPDVLGYIFEQYINDRAQMGAYYTKEDITEYIGKNCILPFLMDEMAKSGSKKHFEPVSGFVWKTLRESGQKYIYPAVTKGYGEPLPETIAIGMDTRQPNLIERRAEWNKPASEKFALPTEIWRETVERLQRCEEVTGKIAGGEITCINDFITYNMDIRSFVFDLLADEKTDHLFIKHFYGALQHVSILDPTCGSGAFLFAALNILEPLYDVCIDRMYAFHKQNPHLFRDELAEIEEKYRSNIQYFIYKSIILRNLYGVDMMAEATEIAKLRLFLKMVAVVEADRRAHNLGLDPLPDIDFNIRCGNTLVGFASLDNAVSAINAKDKTGQMALVFEDELDIVNVVKNRADDLAVVFKSFKQAQLDDDLTAFRQAKDKLQRYQAGLNAILNEYLAFTYGIDNTKQSDKYHQFLVSHQPFHWFAEFYEIIHNNGGFDVIIGNPPYVNIRKIEYKCEMQGFNCSDIYGYVVRRCFDILNKNSRYGFIVMHNLAFSKNFKDIRKTLVNNANKIWFSFFARIPAGLFSGDVRVRNCIFVSENNNSKDKHLFTTRIHRWFTEARDVLFRKLNYVGFENNDIIPMYNSDILEKFYTNSKGKLLAEYVVRISNHQLCFKQSAYNWIAVSNTPAPCYSENGTEIPQSQVSDFFLISNEIKELTLLFLNGKLFFSKWLTFGDEFHATRDDLFSVNVPFHLLSVEDKLILHNLYEQFSGRISDTIQFKLNAGKNVGTYNTSKLWDITDKSDKIFLKYLCNNPDEVFTAVENHIFQTIKTGIDNSEEEK